MKSNNAQYTKSNSNNSYSTNNDITSISSNCRNIRNGINQNVIVNHTGNLLRQHEEAIASRRRFSISALFSGEEESVNDDLSRAQKKLKDLKTKISAQSKRNFLLERDVRYLDSRIALLIQNKILEDFLEEEANDVYYFPDDRKKQLYGNLFFLLQTEPRLVAHLVTLITLSEMDTLLQTVMFTLYGNQYDQREEHLLLSMFQTVLSENFSSANDINSLLRANTPVSRMMTTYTRRGPGQQYLKHALNEQINLIIQESSLNLEINPLTVYNQIINTIESETGEVCDLPRSVTSEEASLNPKVQDVIKPRSKTLIDIANTFLSTIINSLEDVPYGIRWICKQIRDLTRNKFKEATDVQICSLIGGFFFLRFINPAIVTPQSYMIVEKQPSTFPRRTLTLIAKMIQNLANKSDTAEASFSAGKEGYMKHLDSFNEENRDRIRKFLLDLCEVDDFYESLELDQYVALTKKDLSISISLNEIYNTHSLLRQHIIKMTESVLSKQETSKSIPADSYASNCRNLCSVLHDLGEAPAQLPRKDNKSLNLVLFSRWETAPTIHSPYPKEVKKTLTDADIIMLDTKALIIKLLRRTISSGGSLPSPDSIDVQKILRDAILSSDQVLSKTAIRCKQNLRILDERYDHPSVKGDLKRLGEEVLSELKSLKTLLEKTFRELESLETVYTNICDHNKFLKGQLEYYKSYLQNVRIQASGGSGSTHKVGLLLRESSLNSAPRSTGSSVALNSKASKTCPVIGPFKFSHSQLERDGVITESGVPENRRPNIYFSLKSPIPGTFIIALLYKGREKPILEVDLKLDDLLEKQQENIQTLDFDYVQLNVNKTLYLLNKTFIRR